LDNNQTYKVVLVSQKQKQPMPNFTSDYLFDSNKEKASRRFSSHRGEEVIGPKRQTIANVIAFSKALEVKNGKGGPIEMLLN
jgi:hypothetical protein